MSLHNVWDEEEVEWSWREGREGEQGSSLGGRSREKEVWEGREEREGSEEGERV